MAYFIFLAYLSLNFVEFGMKQRTLTLGIVKGWIYLIIPISAFFMFIAVLQITLFANFIDEDQDKRDDILTKQDL